MIRKIVKIDAEKCNGCGLCVDACHEGAIGLKDGKAHLLRDDYCDGLGDCLPACPTGAITFEEREALPYDEAAVQANMEAARKARAAAESSGTLPCGCPGSHARSLAPAAGQPIAHGAPAHSAPTHSTPAQSSGCQSGQQEPRPLVPLGPVGALPQDASGSQLRQWPVQIKLVPANAAYLSNAHLLIAADCTAYAYGNFHRDFIQGRVTLIGCPKLDEPSYYDKFLDIFKNNEIKSVTIARMSVPCCGGLEQAAKKALHDCGKMIPWNVVT
ncbi:4Fe-4S binding protein, partial [Desulfovibrio sp. OttesenSCG-928-C06]|nr:4Fe-4S binding protein [Desulfovibrio sp. OttesenSCG-928-C06]